MKVISTYYTACRWMVRAEQCFFQKKGSSANQLAADVLHCIIAPLALSLSHSLLHANTNWDCHGRISMPVLRTLRRRMDTNDLVM